VTRVAGSEAVINLSRSFFLSNHRWTVTVALRVHVVGLSAATYVPCRCRYRVDQRSRGFMHHDDAAFSELLVSANTVFVSDAD